MLRRRLLLIAGAAVLVGGWYLFRPERLFIDKTVAETFPTAAATMNDMAGSGDMAGMAGGDVAGSGTMADMANTAEPVVVLSGSFHSNAHETRGRATIYRFADGRLVLRLTEFETSNGPDVLVYLVGAPDVTDDDTVKRAGYVSLGALKGNIGAQNYDIPAGTDLSVFRSVTIWCRRFSVNFGTAPIS
jgi:hypothetical protein